MASTDDDAQISIPEPLVCPITLKLMLDPVLASDGHTYERAALQAWLDKGHDTSPVTGADISGSVTPNHTIKQMIQAFLDSNPSSKAQQFSESDPEFKAMLAASAVAKPSAGPLKPAAAAPAPAGAGSNPFAAATTAAPKESAAAPPSPPSSARGNPFGNPFASHTASPAPAPAAAAASAAERLSPAGRTFVSAQQLLADAFQRIVPGATPGAVSGRIVVEAARQRLAAAPAALQSSAGVEGIPSALKDLTASMFKSSREGALEALYEALQLPEEPAPRAAAADALLAHNGLPALFHVLLQPAVYPKASVGQAAACLQSALGRLSAPVHWWTALGMALARRGKKQTQHLSGSTPPDVLQSAAAAFSSGATGLTASRPLQRRRSGSSSTNTAPASAVASRHIGPAANVHDFWSFNVVYTAQGLVLREDFDAAAAAEAAAAAAAADGVPSKHTLGMLGEQSTDERLQVVTDRAGKEWVLPPCPEDALVAALYATALADEPPLPQDASKAIKAMADAGGEKRRSLEDEGYYGEDRPSGVKAWFSWKAPPPSGFEMAQANEAVDANCVEPLLRCLHTVLTQHPTMRPLPRAAARRWCGVLAAVMMSGRRGHTVRAWAAACIAVMATQCDVAAAVAFGWEVPAPPAAAGGAAAGEGSRGGAGGGTNDPLQRFTALQIILAVAAKVRSPGAQACAAAAAESVLTTLLRSFNSDAGYVEQHLPGTATGAQGDAGSDKSAAVAAAAAALAAAPVAGPSCPGSPAQGGHGAAQGGGGSAAEGGIPGEAWLNLLLAFHPRLPQTLCDLLLYGDSATRLHASACATCLALTGPVAVSCLQQVGLVEALTSSLKNDEAATKNSVLQTLYVVLNSQRYSWPPSAAPAAAAVPDGKPKEGIASEGDAGVLTLTGGCDPAERASFVRPPPCPPLLRVPTPWEACAGDISRLGCVYVLADIARSKGTRRVMGMQEQLDRAVASGKLQGAGAGEGGVQFPLGAAVMQALAQCGDVGRDTAQRARWS